MDAGEEFLVVPDDANGSESKAVIADLKNVVNLFTCSIDALNQSTILLKDELHSALSSALERLEPEDGTSTEEILKAFNKSVSSTEDVRKDYVRHLCKRLVALEAEKQALATECTQLKVGTWLSSQSGEVDELQKLITEISCSLRLLEKEAGLQKDPSVDLAQDDESPLATLNFRLTDIRDRISNLCSAKSTRSAETGDKDAGINTKPGTEEEVNRNTNVNSEELKSKSKQPGKKGNKEKNPKTETVEGKRLRRKLEQYLGLVDRRVSFEEKTGSPSGDEQESGSEDSETASVTSTKSNPVMPDLQELNKMFLYARMPGPNPPQMPMMGYNWGPHIPRPIFPAPDQNAFQRPPYMMPMYPRAAGIPGSFMPMRGQIRTPYRPYQRYRRRSYSKPRTQAPDEENKKKNS